MSELLDINAGLDLTGNDEELYRELLKYYLTDNRFDVKELHELIMKSKPEAASYIHRVKGASRQICAKKVSEQGQLIEDILREKASGNLAPLINDFCAFYNQTVKEVKKYLGLPEDSDINLQ